MLLNKYGEKLATMKFGKMKNNWHEHNYEMAFVRAVHPCYQLEFTAKNVAKNLSLKMLVNSLGRILSVNSEILK